MSLSVFTDGGAIGNPGPAAIGVVVKKDGQTIKELAKYLGETTNNVAEYKAVIEALSWIKAHRFLLSCFFSPINFFLDSRLVVNQLNGLFKIKDAKLRNLVIKVRELEREVGFKVVYHHIPRKRNKEADFLVKQILSEKR